MKVIRQGQFWLYEDGTVLPVLEGAQVNPNDWAGTDDKDAKLKPGQQLLLPDGSVVTVRSVGPKGVTVESPGSEKVGGIMVKGTNVSKLPAGTYGVPGLNISLNVSTTGDIITQGAPLPEPDKPKTYHFDESLGLIVDSEGNIARDSIQELYGLMPARAGGAAAAPSAYGYQAPDPYGAAALLFKKYEAMVAQGQVPASEAAAQWQREFDVLQINMQTEAVNRQTEAANAAREMEKQRAELDRAVEEERARRERETTEVSRQLRVQEEAGSRARTVAQNILPSSLPNLQSVTLPLLGNMPANQIDVDQFMSQGLPPLASMTPMSTQLSTPFPNIAGTAGVSPISMIDPTKLPNIPTTQPVPLPNIDDLIQKTISGFPGWWN